MAKKTSKASARKTQTAKRPSATRSPSAKTKTPVKKAPSPKKSQPVAVASKPRKPAVAEKPAPAPKPAAVAKPAPAAKPTPVAKSSPAPRPSLVRKVVFTQVHGNGSDDRPSIGLATKTYEPGSRQALAVEAIERGGYLSEEELRRCKSGLSKKEIEAYRLILMQKRAELLGDVASLKADTQHDGNISNLPLHMADVGSDHYEHEFNLGLMQSDRQTLREIDEALVRIANGLYGICVQSGLPIGQARLDAKPWAKYCIEVIREKEHRGLV
ncbi:MAG: TraR/DksA C4-type zinc finger protein [Phycisphaeraceae bacterium]|nr:TraR/DksA C4-type zinc finger protein [Phycisphaeraceae bacterium]